MPIKGTTSSPFAIHYSNPKIITKLSIPFLPNHILNYIYILHQRSQLQTTRATKLTDMFVESHYLGQAPSAGNQQKLFPIIHHPPKLQTKSVTTTAPPPHATIVDAPIKYAAPPPVMMAMAPSTYCAPMSEHTIPAPDKKNNKRSINPNSEYYSCYKNPQELDKAKNKPTSPAAPDVPKPKVVDLLELHEVDANIIMSLKYTTLRFVHNGPFTRIYLVKNDNGVEFIAKVESKEERKRTLGIEAQVYKDCAGATGIPTIFQCCEVDGNRAIIIQKLGVDLSRIRRALPDQRFSPMDSLKVCLKTFCRIWELHNKGWLHRDIKGSNFVVGAPPDDERIYILDFGLSRPKRDRARQTGIPPIVGTSAYQSINVHSRAEYRAKDDMESWFYMCCHFITGTLPWLDSHKDWMADYKIFCKSSGRQHLVSQLPSQFDSILDIIHRSKDTVDYYKISALLKSAIAQQGQRTVEEQCAWKRDPSIIARALELPTQY